MLGVKNTENAKRNHDIKNSPSPEIPEMRCIIYRHLPSGFMQSQLAGQPPENPQRNEKILKKFAYNPRARPVPALSAYLSKHALEANPCSCLMLPWLKLGAPLVRLPMSSILQSKEI